jgi:anthranilate synthase component 1
VEPPFNIAADLDTPVSAYLKLGPFRPRFLLESVEGGERIARYSFIGFGEGALELRVDADGVTLGGERRARPADREELLSTLREAIRLAPQPLPRVPGLPFTGGLVGAASYDLVRVLERLPELDTAPSGEPDAHYLAPRSILVFDHLTRRVALLHDGSEAERRALEKEIVAVLRGSVPSAPTKRGHSPARPSLDRGAYMDGVRRVKEHIVAGDVYQLVLSSRFTGECDTDPFEVYRALRGLNPSPYMYFLDFDGLAVVGSSPEALVRLEGREAALRPIAGTRPRGADEAEDRALEEELLADEKEGAEHVMLVDLARNDLGRSAVPGSIVVDPYRVVERYSHVMHLVSGVRGVVGPDTHAVDLFADTFPAGTVVGAPKVRAMELIEELEPVRRGIYAGTVGYFGGQGSMDQAIAIRTLTFGEGRYAFQAGAGIVADSVPEREHDEVLAKSAALRSALELAKEGP